MTTSTKFYASVVTLFLKDNINFLKNLKQGFKRAISWNKYRTQPKNIYTTQPKINYLDYMIDPKFRNINRLFVLSFTNGISDPTRSFFDDVNCRNQIFKSIN